MGRSGSPRAEKGRFVERGLSSLSSAQSEGTLMLVLLPVYSEKEIQLDEFLADRLDIGR